MTSFLMRCRMITKTALDYEVTQTSKDGLPVIVVAAGGFTRMNGVNKQLVKIGGIPVIIRTLMAFERCDKISDIILVVRADDVFSVQLLTEQYNISKLSDIVCGGSCRQESVLKGLARVGIDKESVLIHDGARPLVSTKIIENVVEGIKQASAVTCAVPIVDTVKLTDNNGMVEETLDRTHLVAVQTPQAVNVKAFKNAIQTVGDLSCFTDDTSIMEAAGFRVLTVEGERSNIKITTRSDIIMAEMLLEGSICE